VLHVSGADTPPLQVIAAIWCWRSRM
jgi:hypothetical protein